MIMPITRRINGWGFASRWQALLMAVWFTAAVLVGCASGISDVARDQVTYRGGFPALQTAPEAHRGQVTMLGGRIVETIPSADGTEIVVLQLPLASSDKPVLDRPSEGRFLIASPDFLDPAVYAKLTLITVVGEITGHTVRPIGNYDYTLPMLKPIEIKLWPAPDWGRRSPAVSVGVGAGSHGSGAGVGISF